MKETVVSQTVLTLAGVLRKEGLSWPATSNYLGVSVHKLRTRLDPGFLENVRARYSARDKKRIDNAAVSIHVIPDAPLLYEDQLLDRLRAVGHDYAD